MKVDLRVVKYQSLLRISVYVFLSFLFFPADIFFHNSKYFLQYFVLATYLISIFTITTLLLNNNYWVRTLTEIVFFSCCVLECIYILITGNNFQIFDAINFINNSHYSELAISNFSVQFLVAIAIASVVYFFLKIILSEVNTFYPLNSIILIPVTIVYIILSNSIVANSINYFPAIYRAPLSIIFALQEGEIEPLGRKEVAIEPVWKGVKNLILIVDESVAGHFLSINNPQINTTPYLRDNEDKIKNYGVASSFTNYSSGSNLALYSGAQLRDLPDKDKLLLIKANIFQFAKKAGYTTIYIDAQTTDHTLQNFMRGEDLTYIDRVIIADSNVELFIRDFTAIDSLMKTINSERKTFVYFNKYGSHWPYHLSYPRQKNQTFELVKEREIQEVKKYMASISWSVDQFWKKLLKDLEGNDSTLIIYTSDHGQSFNKNLMRHGTVKEPAKTEASVPLMAYDPCNYLTNPKLFSKYSHQNIFPTLLLSMGYEKTIIKKLYGLSLIDSIPPSRRTFLSGDIFNRGGAFINSFDD